MEYYSALKKEENYDTCYNMNESWEYCAKWNKPVIKDKYCMILLIWGYLNQSNSQKQKGE